MSEDLIPRFAVIGNPIQHSKSPWIHARFSELTGCRLHYGKLLAPCDGFAQTVAAMRAAGMQGANVTVPFKFEAHALCTALSDRARVAAAVNTLRFTAHGIEGDNTDGAGLVSDLVRLYGALKGARLLVIGAGGAAAGVLRPLLDGQLASLTLLNRTAEKANALVGALQSAYSQTQLQSGGFDSKPHAVDIVINATSTGLQDAAPDINPAWYQGSTLAYDMMYGAQSTAFMRIANGFGVQAHDGLGMLVGQAAESFFVWHGVRPDVLPVLTQLREQLQGTTTVASAISASGSTTRAVAVGACSADANKV